MMNLMIRMIQVRWIIKSYFAYDENSGFDDKDDLVISALQVRKTMTD